MNRPTKQCIAEIVHAQIVVQKWIASSQSTSQNKLYILTSVHSMLVDLYMVMSSFVNDKYFIKNEEVVKIITWYLTQNTILLSISIIQIP